MSKGAWLKPGPPGKQAAKIMQRLRVGPHNNATQRARIVVTSNGRISEDTLASVSRLVRAGAV